MLTADELIAIRERCDKATPGPWGTEEHKFQITSDDFCFVCHAREDIPALLDDLCTVKQRLIFDVNNMEVDRDRWKARCEAMERAMSKSCFMCERVEDITVSPCSLHPCEGKFWQFDEARFAGSPQ